MRLRMLLFFFLGTLALFGLHYYVYDRLSRYLALGPAGQRAVKIGLGALFVLLWAALPFSRFLRMPLGQPVLLLVYTWLGVLFLTSVVLFGSDLVRWLWATSHLVRPAPPDPAELLSRRAWLERLLGMATLGLLA